MENRKKDGKLQANAIKRVAAGAYLPTLWLFEPAKRPDDRADTAWTAVSFPSANAGTGFTVEDWDAWCVNTVRKKTTWVNVLISSICV